MLFHFLFALWLFFNPCKSQCNTPVAETVQQRDRHITPLEITIVSYNAEWLYQEADCPDFNRFKDIVKKPDQKIWSITDGEDWTINNADNKVKIKGYIDKHIENIAKYLDDMNADIYVIQEACSCEALEAVRDKMDNKAQYHSYLAPCETVGMQTGIITRIDPIRINHGVDNKAKILKIAGDETLKTKRIFRAEFHFGSKPKKLILYGAHLTPGIDDDTATQREVIANAINDLAKTDANADTDDTYVVVTGDLNAHSDDNKVKRTIVAIAGTNQNVKDVAGNLISGKLDGDNKVFVKDETGNGIVIYKEKSRQPPVGAKLLKVIFNDEEIDCDGHNMLWLKQQLSAKRAKTSEFMEFGPGTILELAANTARIVEIERSLRENDDDKLYSFQLKFDHGLLLDAEHWGVPADAKLLQLIFDGSPAIDCNGRNIAWLKAQLADNVDKNTLHIQFDKSRVRMAQNNNRVKRIDDRFIPNQLGDCKVVDVGGVAAGIKLREDCEAVRVVDNPTVYEIEFNRNKPDGDAGKESLECAAHNIAWLQNELLARLAGKYQEEHVIFSSTKPDETVAKLLQNDFAQPPTDDDVDNQYTHWDCNIARRKDGILDYFFLSQSIVDTLTPKLTYVHENYEDPADSVEKERRCKLWSDHTPIKLKLTLPDENDFKYANSIHYYRHYYNKYYASQPQRDFIWFIGIFLSMFVFCMLSCGSCIMGSLCGWITAKEAYSKIDIENQCN